MKVCSVTVDVDSLNSNFKGFGLKKSEYSYSEFERGINNIIDFFNLYDVRGTFFFVARDLEISKNARLIPEIASKNHEIASHSYSHPQGFRYISTEQKEYELRESKRILEELSGREVIGFRSPGWNISEDTLPILRRTGYRYDSSVFPTFIAGILKVLHYWAMRKRDRLTRTTMGHLYYAFSPTIPYHPSDKRMGMRGSSDFIEFPIQVAGFTRLPFYATFHLSKPGFIQKGYDAVKKHILINYQMHLSDFVDYRAKAFDGELPHGSGSYMPLSLKMRLSEKMRIWRRVFDLISLDYRFETLSFCNQNIITHKSLEL
jgi:hypothetical protein